MPNVTRAAGALLKVVGRTRSSTMAGPSLRSLVAEQVERCESGVPPGQVAVLRPASAVAPLTTIPEDSVVLEHLGATADASLSALVLDQAIGPAGSPPAATREVLEAAYRALAPDGLLLVPLSAPLRRGGLGPGAWWGELTNALYLAGFHKPRLRESGGGTHLVVARRSPLPPPTERRQRLTVVMPVYNEAGTFRTVIEALLDKEIPEVDVSIVIVESNSSDGTRAEVLRVGAGPKVRVVLEDRARGKGHAVRSGLAVADGDFVLIQDADLEYDLGDYEALLAPLRSGEAGFVLGVRQKTHGARYGIRHFEAAAATSQVMNIGNAVFLALFNLVYAQHLRDPFTMYKVFRRDCLEGLSLECDRFDFDWELVAKLIRSGYQPVEVPVAYRSRSFSEGKKIAVLRDPLTWVRACLKYRFSRLGESP